MASVLTVTQLNTFIKSIIDGEPRLRNIMISGEISNFTNHYKSGHMYFSLKDSGGVVKAVMFSDSAKRLKFVPKDGMKVIVAGRVSLYEASGQYQVYVQSMQPDGIGALNLAYEQLKEKLSKEGLFDNQRPIPQFPEKVAVITSPTGDAIKDILNVLGRRWPVAEVIFCPTMVQGDFAEAQLVSSVKKINDANMADVIIIGRGGGPIEDLWTFNSELLARAIYDSKIPVISGVGHETDYTICDFVSDLRAPTPTGAAELAVPNMYSVMNFLDSKWEKLESIIEEKIIKYKLHIDRLSSSRKLSNPHELLTNKYQRLCYVSEKMANTQSRILSKNQLDLAKLSAKLDELSPLKTMSRGYSVLVNEENRTVNSVKSVKIGDKLTALMTDGTLELEVKRRNDA